MAKIYTKTGDSGETGLIGGSRVPKNHIRVEAYGTIDEANALIGIILAQQSDSAHHNELEHIQDMLFSLGALLANPKTRQAHPDENDVKYLENLIDQYSATLPPLTHFILPGGIELAAFIHLARTVVRRAERRVVTVSQHQDVPAVSIQYLNRLSDYLFMLARLINHEHNVTEKQWPLQ